MKDKGIQHYRLVLTNAGTHQVLKSLGFTKHKFFTACVSAVVLLLALSYLLFAFTPLRYLIPGYPDSQTRLTIIQNAIKIDSLENVILKWQFYTENLDRAIKGEKPYPIDSIIGASAEDLKASKEFSESLSREEGPASTGAEAQGPNIKKEGGGE